MFSGIIKDFGIITKIDKKIGKIVIKFSNLDVKSFKIGDSVACNGVCLTVTEVNEVENEASFIASEHTMEITNLGLLKLNNVINIENSLRYNDEINGHFVFGHVDCMINFISKTKFDDDSYEFFFTYTSQIRQYIVYKGSVCINGISLTVKSVEKNMFSVIVIPHTYQSTNLSMLNIGEFVNFEVDMIARYSQGLITFST